MTRRYFIAADPVDWDYAPAGANRITGEKFDKDHDQSAAATDPGVAASSAEQAEAGGPATYTEPGPKRIGRVYRKSLYREYTDSSFATAKVRGAEWDHLGFLGPPIHAEVGDTIEVAFRNNTPYPASMHPHGVLYDKASEGATYDDGRTDANAGIVAPGATYTYRWKVPERAGPGPMDGSSVMWMYHSHVDEPVDVDAGLMGSIIITKRGMARADGTPKDVDRELVASYFIDNENNSPWLDANIAAHVPGTDKTDAEFTEANLKHTINGYLFGNGPGFTVRQGEHVRWYVMAMGNEADTHTPHWHGNTVTVMGMRTDTVSVFPATMVTADMNPDNPGRWLFHCHVSDHLKAGMITTYNVQAAAGG